MQQSGMSGGSFSTSASRRRRSGESAPPMPPSVPPPPPVSRAPAEASPGRRGRRPLIGTVDRYVLRSFLWNYVLFLAVLLGLFIVIDMVVKFDEFTEITGDAGLGGMGDALTVVWGIIDYYRFQVFRIFSLIGGIVPVVAASFTLMRMSRNNELVALLAAGIPLLRIAAPIIFASVVLNLVLMPVNQEVLIPQFAPQLTRERGATDALGAGESLEAMRGVTSEDVPVLLHAGAYFPPLQRRPATLHNAEFLERLDDDRVRIVSADFARWDRPRQLWLLENGRVEQFSPRGGRPAPPTPLDTYASTITPESISLARDRTTVDLLSTVRINQLLESLTPVARLDLLRVRDARLAGFVLNIILVLLAIPCVLRREPHALRTSAARAFMLVGSCMSLIFLTQNLAGQPVSDELQSIWPALMAWMPIFIYGPLAVFMLDRIKS